MDFCKNFAEQQIKLADEHAAREVAEQESRQLRTRMVGGRADEGTPSTPRSGRDDAAERSRRRRGLVAATPRGCRVDAAEWSRRRRGEVASTPWSWAKPCSADLAAATRRERVVSSTEHPSTHECHALRAAAPQASLGPKPREPWAC